MVAAADGASFFPCPAGEVERFRSRFLITLGRFVPFGRKKNTQPADPFLKVPSLFQSQREINSCVVNQAQELNTPEILYVCEREGL